MQIELFTHSKSKESLEKYLLDTPIEELNLPVRAYHVLETKGLKTVRDVMKFGLDNIIKLRHAGTKTVKAISEAVEPYIPEHLKHALIEHSPTFEESIKNSFGKKLLSTFIEELKLTERAFNALTNAGLKTIEDIINYGLNTLQNQKNVGIKTINNIKHAILMIRTQTQSINETSFIDAIESILACVTTKNLPIIEARYGYDDGRCKTLEEIGNNKGFTRERVRQIIVKEFRQIKTVKRRILQSSIENIEKLLLQRKGIISIHELAKDEYFNCKPQSKLGFYINLIAAIYEERYRIIDKYFLTSLSDEEIKALQSTISNAALNSELPIDEEIFTNNIISFIGPISKDYFTHYLLDKEHIKISNGKVLSVGRIYIPQQIKLLMKDIDKPMHFTEIAKIYYNRFGNAKIRSSDLVRTIHLRIGDSKDFIIVNPGTFILREKFKVPDNINEIVNVSKIILRNLQTISDTRYLINELKNRKIDVGNLNAYSLKSILVEYPDFVGYRKFEIGIEELIDQYERRPLDDLIFELLSSTEIPLNAKAIWKEISKQRGFPKYAVQQQLINGPRFIRIAPGTYTVTKNIPQYEEKIKIIINFAKGWIQLKKNAISAFFITEVLKETEEIKDVSLGLVEHALAISSEFKRLPNGFYDLVHKNLV